MRATNSERIVIGVSGGLDSTQALLVAAKAFDALGLPRKNILGFTMPGFATSEGTKSNAWTLMKALGVTGEEIDIRPAAKRMLEDLGHPFAKGEPVYDVTFENVQAGLRTDYLFRLANQRNAFVLGTGDLSELALGWCTYGVGDHMSHYNVNGSVAKTLIQYLVRWVMRLGSARRRARRARCWRSSTPRSRPSWSRRAERRAAEHPVEDRALRAAGLPPLLHHALRPASLEGRVPRVARVARCAARRLAAELSARKRSTPTRWPRSRNGWECSCCRFFEMSQFKRSALPNGPKVVSGGSLSPRGDWRAPSDGNARAWLAELQANVPGSDQGQSRL